jgi:FMN-dependent NADH-azoreductase
MTMLLHLDSAIQGAASVSRILSKAAVSRLTQADPSLEVTYRDLVDAPLSHLTLATFGEDEAQAVLAQFMAAQVVVIGASMYNFTVPSQLKSWIDRILVAGQTFRYGEAGPEGLAGDKRVVVTLARGGVYDADGPMGAFEHAETYLRAALSFIGVASPEFVIAEGTATGDEAKTAAIASALDAIEALPAGRSDG